MTSTMPATVKSAPRVTRTTEMRVFSIATSRSAASGGTRDARIAGTTIATRVTIIPTANAATTVEGFTVSAPLVIPAPSAWNSARKPAASAIPTIRPRIDAARPIAVDSSPIDASTWVREAPIARSNADSRVRWAMMIENVL
jgi:hypothetical protein